MRSGPAVRNYNYYSAPPLVGGYGMGGYGGMTFAPSFGMPLFYGGGFFNILIFMVRTAFWEGLAVLFAGMQLKQLLCAPMQFVASTLLGVVRSLFNRRRDDEFDD